MLNLIFAVCQIQALDDEYHYAEYRYAEYRYAECHYAECHYAEYHYAECHYAECYWNNISSDIRRRNLIRRQAQNIFFCK